MHTIYQLFLFSCILSFANGLQLLYSVSDVSFKEFAERSMILHGLISYKLSVICRDMNKTIIQYKHYQKKLI